MQTRLALTSALLLGVTASPLVAFAQEVGTAAAVNPASTGTPPSRPTRVLELGSRVVHRERISTSAGGNVQLVFVDKTTMSIGPNSDLVIDDFVYDPNAGTGRMAASMTKGVLRFVGGNTSHSGGAEIKTPTATLGIRGGVATVEVRPCGGGGGDCGTKVISHFGTLSVTTNAGTEIIRRPGFVVNIQSANVAPSAPRRATQAEVSQTNQRVTSAPGQTGGKPNVSAAVIARVDTVGPALTQVGTAVVSEQRQTVARTQSGSQAVGLSVAPLDATSPTQTQQATTEIRQQVTTQIQQAAAPTLSTPAGTPVVGPVSPPASPPPSSPVESIVSAVAFALGYKNGSPPFLPPGAFAASPANTSQILGYSDGGANASGTANTSSRVAQAGLSISGQGAAQSSSIYLLTGRSNLAANGTALFEGGYSGTARSSASGLPSYGSGSAVASGAAVTLDERYAPTSISARPGRFRPDGTITPENATYVSRPGQAATSYNYQLDAARVAAPAGLGANRPGIDTVPAPYYGGYVGGLVTTRDNSTGASGVTNAVSGLFDLAFNPASSRFGVTLSVKSGAPDASGLQTAFLDYGSPVDNYFTRPATVDGRGTYVDYNNFGAREAAAPDGSFTSSVNGSAVTDNRGVFVSSDMVNAKSLFPGVNFCQCEYTRWGFWSSETTRNGPSGQSLTDLTHLGTWVFGAPADATQIPSSGTATYDGHAIATFKSGADEYVAAGNFQNVVNFGARTARATVSNLDGRSYAGPVTIGTTSNFVSGTLPTVSGSAASLQLNGQFTRGVIGPAGEMNGSVAISGQNYVGSGIFAGATQAISPGR